MHSLHIGKYFYPYSGGIENFMLDLTAALHRRGVTCSALVHSSPGNAGQETAPQFDALRHFRRVRSLGQIAYAPLSPGFGPALAHMLRAAEPDLLHLHLPNISAFWALALPAARRLPWVVHWHSDVTGPGLDISLRLLYPGYRLFEQALLRRARAIIATSPAYLESSPALARWRHKCQVIPLGLNPGRMRQHDTNGVKAWRLENRLHLLAVGRLTRYKGLDLLIDAIQDIDDIELVIAGDGSERPRLEHQINRLGLERRVHLIGAVGGPQRNALLAACDVLCLPSLNRAEAFGLILLEAMALGKPVIAANVPGSGMGWVVRHRDDGLLFPAADRNGLAAALRQLRDQPELREKLGASARQRFQQSFHIDRIAGLVESLYRRLLAAQI